MAYSTHFSSSLSTNGSREVNGALEDADADSVLDARRECWNSPYPKT